MNHTPGPWYANGHKVWKDIGDFAHMIATCGNWSEETEENARLIALAPEMLAALREIANIERQSPYEMSNGAECANIANEVLNKLKTA